MKLPENLFHKLGKGLFLLLMEKYVEPGTVYFVYKWKNGSRKDNIHKSDMS